VKVVMVMNDWMTDSNSLSVPVYLQIASSHLALDFVVTLQIFNLVPCEVGMLPLGGVPGDVGRGFPQDFAREVGGVIDPGVVEGNFGVVENRGNWKRNVRKLFVPRN
jgi:hypothetical protein